MTRTRAKRKTRTMDVGLRASVGTVEKETARGGLSKRNMNGEEWKSIEVRPVTQSRKTNRPSSAVTPMPGAADLRTPRRGAQGVGNAKEAG